MTVVRVPPVLRAEAGGVARGRGGGRERCASCSRISPRKLPALGSRVYDEGAIHPYVNVYVDGEDVRTRDGLETPVRDSSTVILLPAMAGGC